MHPSLLKRAAGEFIGTFALVLAGCGAIIVNSLTASLTHVGIAFTFGLTIMVMVAAIGHLSGAHFNPAVSLAFFITRFINRAELLAYWLAQFAGAISAAFTLAALFGQTAQLGATLPGGAVEQSFILEILLTAVLMFVIISVATDSRALGMPPALAIGSTVILAALWGGPISGASMNPARSLGPALVAGVWQDQWLYLVAPILGAAVAALLYQWLRE